jgi:hypothetical protein
MTRLALKYSHDTGVMASSIPLSALLFPAFADPASPRGPQEPILTVQDMLTGLRRGGIPVSSIAEILRVERKTVYSWLKGGEVREVNTQRVRKVYELLTTVLPNINIRTLYRFWHAQISGNKTLQQMLTAESIDEGQIRTALESIKYSAQNLMAADIKGVNSTFHNPILDSIPEATPS